MLRTGVSQEPDIGVTQYPFGYQTIWKKSFVLVQSKNYKSYQDAERSRIFTEKALITLPFHLNKVRVC